MRRRRFLAAAATGAAVATAGCSAIGGPRELSNPRSEVEDDGETHLHFGADERLATLTISPTENVETPPIPVDFHVWHREGTRVTGLELRLRATTGPAKPPGSIYVEVPQWGDSPEVRLLTDLESGWRVVELDAIGELGEGTVTVESYVRPFGDGEGDLRVAATIDFEETGLFGREYRATARTEIPLRAGRGATPGQ